MIIDHTHGVHPGTRCTHADCRTAHNRYLKQYKYDRTQGRDRRRSLAEVRLHIAVLQGAGWSLRAIAGAAHISPSTVSRYARGHVNTGRAREVARILAVDPSTVPSKPSSQTGEIFVSRVGTVRRIQALLALGWRHTDLEARGATSRDLLHQQGRWVTRTTHDKVAAIYRDLSQRPGPSDLTRRRAARLGYLSPAAWDDIDHDPEPFAGLDDEWVPTVDDGWIDVPPVGGAA